ncbi:MAG: LmbE family protein [Candidatus Saccharibacteria bacterium]|nr:LmbE family protein [Candidatus Saccharibacteria bacterium]
MQKPNQCLCTPQEITQLGTILSVWAHPDDESYSCAGIMAAATQNGQRVVCLTATKGELGVQDESRWPAARLADIRAEEMMGALKALGLAEHHWLGYHDGGCDRVPANEAVAKIKAFIADIKPNTILTFGPDGMTGHPDHQTVSKWVDQAVRGTDITVYHAVQEEQVYVDFLEEADKKFNIFFNIDKPPLRKTDTCAIALNVTGELLNKKYAALKAMPSQTEAILSSTPKEQLNRMLTIECFVTAK